MFHHGRRAGYHDAFPTRAARRQKSSCWPDHSQLAGEQHLHHGSCSCSSVFAVAEQPGPCSSVQPSLRPHAEEKEGETASRMRSSTLAHWSFCRRRGRLWKARTLQLLSSAGGRRYSILWPRRRCDGGTRSGHGDSAALSHDVEER
jgi:hypothetical protein